MIAPIAPAGLRECILSLLLRHNLVLDPLVDRSRAVAMLGDYPQFDTGIERGQTAPNSRGMLKPCKRQAGIALLPVLAILLALALAVIFGKGFADSVRMFVDPFGK